MSISIFGIFVADLVFFGEKIPVEGETILGKNFVIGPGGKGSNQAVAAAKAVQKLFLFQRLVMINLVLWQKRFMKILVLIIAMLLFQKIIQPVQLVYLLTKEQEPML